MVDGTSRRGSPRLRALIDSDRVAWVAVITVSLATFFALATAGRLPSVDLPQHAIILRRMIEDNGAYQVDWGTPYIVLFLIARVFAWFTDPVTAIWLATSLALAALPLSSAALAASLRRSPALGCFAMLAAYSEVTGWGFASLIVGANAMCLTLAAAVHYARTPSRARGAWLLAAMLLAYWSHVLAWMVVVPAVWWIAVLRMRPLRWRALWPMAVGTVVTAAVFAMWNLGRVLPETMRETAQVTEHGPGLGTRVLELPTRASSFGRTGELATSWNVLALILVVTLAASLWHSITVYRRARRAAGSTRRPSWRSMAKRLALPAILVASVACYLDAPMVWSGVFHVFPRFLLFSALLLPVVLAGRRAVRGLALLAVPAALSLSLQAGAESLFHANRTQCIDRLSESARPGEALVNMFKVQMPEGYAQPVDWHLAAEIVARKGGWLSFDFADIGASPVRYRQGWSRTIMPAGVGGRYRKEHGVEYTAWFVVDSATDVVAQPGFEVHQCGRFTLVSETRVEPGSKPATRYLPHPTP